MSRAFCYLCIEASLGLLLCTLLVVHQIRPETRPRGVLCCVSVMGSGSENSADQFVTKDRLRKACNLEYRRLILVKRDTFAIQAIPISVSVPVSPVFNSFSFCRNATERHIQGVLVQCSVRILLNTHSNWSVSKIRCYSSKSVA